MGWVPQSAFWRHWHKAVVEADRPDLPFHALRHYAGTRYAQTGATIRETMARLGHSSTKAAMRYQHAGSRDDELASVAAADAMLVDDQLEMRLLEAFRNAPVRRSLSKASTTRCSSSCSPTGSR